MRPERFVTQKIARAVRDIADGKRDRLTLGNLDIWRDWGWAGEYVVAMHLMMQQDVPDDYVVCTGNSTSLRDFVNAAFAAAGLVWTDHVDIDEHLFRPTELKFSRGLADKARSRLGWSAELSGGDVARRMVAALS